MPADKLETMSERVAAKRKRPTIDDVAREAGVSRGTVSRVLNGGRWVSQDAGAAVQEAIKRTGYRVNPHARSLATRRTGSIAFLLNETTSRLFNDRNFSTIVTEVSAALAKQDTALVLLLAGTKQEQAMAREFLLGGHVDGVFVVSWHENSGSPLLRDIIAAEIPIVACGAPLGFEKKVSWVAADDYAGAFDVVTHLVSTGRTAIATITGPRDTPGGLKRLQAFRDVLGDAVDESLLVEGDYSYDGGWRGMTLLLDSGTPFDAVFAANDEMAAGAIAVAAQRGLRVPQDVAIAGFDDSPVATAVHPTITTARQPFAQISAEMASLMANALAGGARTTVTIQTELVVRESA